MFGRPLRPRFGIREPAHLVRAGPGQPPAAPKSSPVAVRRLSFGQPEPWLLARLAELTGEPKEPFAGRRLDVTVNRPVQLYNAAVVGEVTSSGVRNLPQDAVDEEIYGEPVAVAIDAE